MKFGEFVGRFLFSVLFLLAGIGKIMDPHEAAQYTVAKTDSFYGLLKTIEQVQPYIPYINATSIIKHNPDYFIKSIGIFELLTGIAILFKYNYLGVIMGLALVPITLIMHNPLTVPKDQYFNELVNCVKNLAIIGICIFISVPYETTEKVEIEEGEKYSAQEQRKFESKKGEGKKAADKNQNQNQPKKQTKKTTKRDN
jgi:uncharacterized membrane protein YphA (DoxX/SURF4 family)